MFMVDTQGQATHYPHAVPLRTRTHSTAKRVLLGVMSGLALLFIIGAHAQADAVQVQQVQQACTAKHDDVHTMTFNPCATLDTSQVQDKRIGAPTCVWDKGAEQWVSLPCHYQDADLDLDITQQP